MLRSRNQPIYLLTAPYLIKALLSFVVDFRNFCLLSFISGGDSCGINVQADTPQKLCFCGGLAHAPRKASARSGNQQ